MISKNKLKYIKSLQLKKFRKQENAFLIEGAKSILELLNSDFKIHSLFLTDEFFNCYNAQINQHDIEVTLCSEKELADAGTFTSNNAGIAIANIKPNKMIIPGKDEYILMLDEIKDPGNLGTIIRIADWYGIDKIVCSENTTDLYSPKVIAATMGSFTRVSLYYCDLKNYLSMQKTYTYGAILGGKNLYDVQFREEGIIIIGNESKGIDSELTSLLQESVAIPSFGQAESLNAGIATAVILDNLKRQQHLSSKKDF